jgi:hypothetical protein
MWNARWTALFVVVLWQWWPLAAVRADIFLLVTGGEIHGELANPDESPRRQFVIRPYAGGELTLDASRVTSIVQQRPIDAEYHRKQIEYDDSVQGHWDLAEWCRENRLRDQRRFHLEQILRLDTDHAEARRLLGYDQVDGKWLTRDEKMRSRGYVKHLGRWMLPQEKQILEKHTAAKQLEKEWYEKVKRYNSWLSGVKRPRGEEHLLAITDAHATDALVRGFERTKSRQDRGIYARALSNVGTPKAFESLTKRTLVDPDEDFRYQCLELLERHKPPVAVANYVTALKSKDNQQVNRAATGLAYIGDLSVVNPLIDALITTHKYKLGNQNPGAVSTSFGGVVGSQGNSFSSGGGSKIVFRRHRNEAVLSALRELTGKDFDYDQSAWKSWQASQQPPAPKINSRRDE